MRFAIPEANAKAFRQALHALNNSGVPYVVGGAFAMHHYSGVWRNTNDLDIYLERRCVPSAVHALTRAGFRDHGEMAVDDRHWIYHAVKNETFIDLIWQPPNRLRPVDSSFYAEGEDGALLEVPVCFMPPEELIWAKIFTMNRHRCDWPDIFHIVRAMRDRLDWQHLIDNMDEHWPVLLSFVVLFDWVYPGESDAIPDTVRNQLIERKQAHPPSPQEPTREAILDPWIHTRPVQ